MEIDVVVGDITKLPVDAIVNAANTSLLGGGGVDGAIHRTAGPKLLEECRSLGGCPVGEARLTAGYDLPSRFVIHTVGPIWQGGDKTEAELLQSCYQTSLALCNVQKISTVAFPCISTGVYGYPKEEAAGIAYHAVSLLSDKQKYPHKVIFCCFSNEDGERYRELLRKTNNA